MSKKNKGNTRSLTLVVIIMAIICVFIGYIVGANIFRWIQDKDSNISKTDTEVVKENIVDQSSLQENTTVNRSEQEDNKETEEIPGVQKVNSNDETNQKPDEFSEFYKIQVGAFSSKDNAEKFKLELEEKGYNVIIKDASTYRVRVIGEKSQEKTEKIEQQLIKLGYDTFIVK
ncbi:MAG: SPOR domain-containing protein [Halanaerobiales bacterium]|nr:SPOR domain-containing protein [Halanaerobiales bacterium]